MADMLRQSEENGSRLRSMKSSIGQAEKRRGSAHRGDRAAHQRDRRRLRRRCKRRHPGQAHRPGPGQPSLPRRRRPAEPRAAPATASEAATATDPGEDAYTEGFHLWEAGQYDQAIAALKSFVGDYPKHRRVSYANNLIGRALLDKGDARSAAAALLANYRSNPGGERAPDSLFYLGQALMKLGQPARRARPTASSMRSTARRSGPTSRSSKPTRKPRRSAADKATLMISARPPFFEVERGGQARLGNVRDRRNQMQPKLTVSAAISAP